MYYVKQKIILKLEIEKLDIAQSYFKGKLKLDEKFSFLICKHILLNKL